MRGGLAGALVGLAMGGPLGAVVGGMLGDKLEPGSAQAEPDDEAEPRERPRGRRTRPSPEREQARAVVQIATVSLLAKIAKIDGRVDPAEIKVVDRFFRESLGLSAPDRKVAIRIFEAAKASPHTPRQFARQVRELFGAERRPLLEILGVLAELAAADGRWEPAEDRSLRDVAAELGLSGAEVDRFKALHFKDPDGDYAVLGLTRSASDDEVRRAFRRLAKDFHPDRIAAKDLPPAFTDFARQQFERIQQAYDRVRTARGMA